jgi:twitching motility two-component system response regulator PilG
MDDAVLRELLVAYKPEEKAAIVAESIFNTFSEAAALVARRCIILHWFDEAVVEALLKDIPQAESQFRDIYEQIRLLLFVEVLPWGLTFNSLTREGLLYRYTLTQPILLRTAAQLAAPAYITNEGDGKVIAEAFFCYMISGEETLALDLLNRLVEQAANRGNREYVSGLLELASEAQQFPFVSPLPISKILEAHHFDAESPSIEKPAAQYGARQIRASQRKQHQSTEPTVLVVDDSPTVRKIVQMALKREHIRVITADDGLSALLSVADESPALILLDAQLPRMDGYRLCQVIRKNLQFRQIPIIILSGRDSLLDITLGRFVGVTDYLTKPFVTHELVNTVKRYLSIDAQKRI